jgi:hypothetical protein
MSHLGLTCTSHYVITESIRQDIERAVQLTTARRRLG